MRTPLPVLAVTMAAVIYVSCSGSGGKVASERNNPADSLYTESLAMAEYVTQPERSLSLIDSALSANNITAERAVYLRCCVYWFMADKKATIPELLLPPLEDDDLSMEDREDYLLLLSKFYRANRNDVMRLRVIDQLSDLYHEDGNSLGENRILMEKAELMCDSGYDEDGVRILKSAISSLGSIDSRTVLDYWSYGQRALMRQYAKSGNADELIQRASAILEKAAEYAKNPEKFGEIIGPEVQSYADYLSAEAYAWLALGYGFAGEKALGRAAVESFENTATAKRPNMRRIITRAYLELGDYSEMRKGLDAIERTMGSDTLNANYAEALRMRSEAASGEGRYREALGYSRRYNNILAELNDEKTRADAAEFAVIYKLKEQELAREAAEHESIRKGYLLSLYVFVIIILIAFLLFQYLHYRLTLKKNKVLAEQIAKGVALQKDSEEIVPEKANPGEMSAEELYNFLSGRILKEKYYLINNFSRQMLMDTYGLSRDQIGRAFSSAGTSLPAFVNDCRLEQACLLLAGSEDKSIEDIALESGFSSRVSFSRSFRQKYALTPSEYRNNIQKKA